jgi:hypothetical protein
VAQGSQDPTPFRQRRQGQRCQGRQRWKRQRSQGRQGRQRPLRGLGGLALTVQQPSTVQPPRRFAEFMIALAAISLAEYPRPNIPESSVVGGRLQLFAEQWSTADPFLGSVIQQGVFVQFADGPPPPYDAGESSFAPSETVLVREEVNKLITKGAVRPVPEYEAFLVCSMFLVDKKGGSYRPVLNLKPLNLHTAPKHFKMEGMPVVKESLQEGDWMCTVDLSDAFFHVPLHPEHQRFFQFRWDGLLYQYLCCPFGWSRSPQWFQAFTSHIAKICRSKYQIRLIVYLDDFLVLGKSKQEAEKNTQILLCLLQHFGFSPNWTKSKLLATQQREFLGTVIDSQLMALSVPQEKLSKYRRAARRLLRRARGGAPCSLTDLQSMVGKLQSCAQCIPLCRMRMAGLFRALRQAMHFGQPVKLDFEAMNDLESWVLLSSQWNGKGFRVLTPDYLFTTDAFPVGWGGHCTVPPQPQVLAQGRFLSLTKLDSTNEKELLAILYCFRSFQRLFRWSSCHIRIVTDSMTAMLYLNKSGGRVPSLMAITKKILKYALSFNITISAEYITSEDNKLADAQSREFVNPQNELRIQRQIFQKIDSFFGPHEVDAFAAVENHQLPLYVSWRPDPYSMYPDLFSRTCPRGRLYCFPPFALILRLLTKIRKEGRDATVIVPFWVGRPFWPVMLDLLTEWPALLPMRSLKSPKGIFKRGVISHHQLLACPVSGNVERTSVFQQMRSSTHWNATSKTTQRAALRFSSTKDTFPSTCYPELKELILRRYSPIPVS